MGLAVLGFIARRACQTEPPRPQLTLSTLSMLKMAFHIISRIGDELESELFLHLAGAYQNLETKEIQAKSSVYKDRMSELEVIS